MEEDMAVDAIVADESVRAECNGIMENLASIGYVVISADSTF